MSRHPKSGRVVIDQVDVEPGLRADQILTGAWFGLPSTRDSGTLGLIHEHSTLLLKQKKDEHEANRQRELEEILKQRLTEYSGTAVETLGLQAAAEIEAETPVTEAVADREELRSRITDRLRQKQMAGKGDTDASVRGASKTE